MHTPVQAPLLNNGVVLVSFVGPLNPDWVIVGAIRPGSMVGDGEGDGVVLFASRNLGRADIEVNYDRDYVSFRGHAIREATSAQVTLTCVMHDFVWVEAADYGTAFSMLDDLFKQWAEHYDHQNQRISLRTPELPSNVRALSAGDD